jgi:transposase
VEEDASLPRGGGEGVVDDKACDADKRAIEPLVAAGRAVVIPPRDNRKNPRDYDTALYDARHLVENYFCGTQQFRAVATRYEKTRINILAARQLVAVLHWLN